MFTIILGETFITVHVVFILCTMYIVHQVLNKKYVRHQYQCDYFVTMMPVLKYLSAFFVLTQKYQNKLVNKILEPAWQKMEKVDLRMK